MTALAQALGQPCSPRLKRQLLRVMQHTEYALALPLKLELTQQDQVHKLPDLRVRRSHEPSGELMRPRPPARERQVSY